MLVVVDDDVDGHYNDGSDDRKDQIEERGKESIDEAVEDVIWGKWFEFGEGWLAFVL